VLADKLRRVAKSVLLNIAEGANSQGAHEVSRYYTALGFAREARAALAISAAWSYVDATVCGDCDKLLDRLSHATAPVSAARLTLVWAGA
jgi:four helix bundle protein